MPLLTLQIGHYTAYHFFRLFPSLTAQLSFACGHHPCLISLNAAHYTPPRIDRQYAQQSKRSAQALMNLFRINTPHRYETAYKDTTTPEIQPHPPDAERCYVLKGDQTEVIPCISHRLKTGCQWQMFSVFPCCSRRRLWAAYTATTCAGRPQTYLLAVP